MISIGYSGISSLFPEHTSVNHSIQWVNQSENGAKTTVEGLLGVIKLKANELIFRTAIKRGGIQANQASPQTIFMATSYASTRWLKPFTTASSSAYLIKLPLWKLPGFSHYARHMLQPGLPLHTPFRSGLRWILGLPVQTRTSNCAVCGREADTTGVHYVTCQKSGERSRGHTRLRNVVANALRAVAWNVETEKPLPPQVPLPTSTERLVPADVFIRGCDPPPSPLTLPSLPPCVGQTLHDLPAVHAGVSPS